MSRQQFVGKVISDKMQKTLVVEVTWVQHHAVYKKAVRRHTKLYVHDPKAEGHLGDRVLVTASRPISKTKRFLLTRVLQRGVVIEAIKEEIAELAREQQPEVAAPVAEGPPAPPAAEMAIASEGPAPAPPAAEMATASEGPAPAPQEKPTEAPA